MVEKATHLGAKTVVPLGEVPGVGRLAVLADPGGAVFAVIQLMGGVVEESKESAETTVRTNIGTGDLLAAPAASDSCRGAPKQATGCTPISLTRRTFRSQAIGSD
jgi:hypothetical protein